MAIDWQETQHGRRQDMMNINDSYIFTKEQSVNDSSISSDIKIFDNSVEITDKFETNPQRPMEA